MYTEMKLMDLARRAYELDNGEVIDFANKGADEAEWYGGWMGIKRLNEFDNDNLQYLIGYYGGECNARFYAISEYDERIGEFCEEKLGYDFAMKLWRAGEGDQKYIDCIAKAIADFLLDYEGNVSETITVDEEI